MGYLGGFSERLVPNMTKPEAEECWSEQQGESSFWCRIESNLITDRG